MREALHVAEIFFDKAPAHASDLVGCQKTSEAIIVDRGRDIRPYLEAARMAGMAFTSSRYFAVTP